MRALAHLLKQLPRRLLRGAAYSVLFAFVACLALVLIRPTLAGRLANFYDLPLLRSAAAINSSAGGSSHADAQVASAPFAETWVPHPPTGAAPANEIRIGAQRYKSLQAAADAVSVGETIILGAGTYRQGFHVKQDHVTIIGDGHVVLDGVAIAGKAAMVIDGEFTRVINIECRRISVRANNGACVRLQGRHLQLEHVYFHDSQQGILSVDDAGRIQIIDSRFERLGEGGQAHGIYVSGDKLEILNSRILRSKSQGHEVKSRSRETVIADSVIASLDGDDSRLIDLPHGGVVTIERSVLAQGPASVNGNLLGFGMEGNLHNQQSLVFRNNIVFMERASGNLFLDNRAAVDVRGVTENIFVGSGAERFQSGNSLFADREAAGFAPYPYLPRLGQPR